MLPNSTTQQIFIYQTYFPNTTTISTGGVNRVISPLTLKFSIFVQDWPSAGATSTASKSPQPLCRDLYIQHSDSEIILTLRITVSSPVLNTSIAQNATGGLTFYTVSFTTALGVVSFSYQDFAIFDGVTVRKIQVLPTSSTSTTIVYQFIFRGPFSSFLYDPELGALLGESLPKTTA